MTIPGEYRAARALDYFHQGYNCSQSVFTAFADVCGLSEETALRLSSPLGAGIGRMREVCGAFCGLSMVAGSLHGNTSPDTGKRKNLFPWCSPWPQTSRKIRHAVLPGTAGPDPGTTGGETARPGDRTAAYYASRPCERCIAFARAWRRIWKPAPGPLKRPAFLRKTGRFNHERRNSRQWASLPEEHWPLLQEPFSFSIFSLVSPIPSS